ncbi:MAG: TrkA family potassium uptake protein [Planctomycetota bacterium]|nr:MAG: TrkA family potassium uptake protein [Planctomycetota bacterium]
MKTILVLGLGKFGSRVVDVLSKRKGVRIFAFDREDKVIERLAEKVHTAGSGDLNDAEALKSFLNEIGTVHAAVISVGDAVNTSILAALMLREIGVQRIIIKAVDESHRRVLEAIDHGFPGGRHFDVLIPELDAAERTGRLVASSFVANELTLAEGFGMMEVKCPPEWTRRTLRELELRRRYHITVVGYRVPDASNQQAGDLQFATPDTKLPEECLITVVGRREDLEALEQKFGS